MIEKQISDLINHTLSVIKNPQASPRETVTLVGIAVVLLLAVLVFASLFFVGKPRSEEEEEPRPPEKPRSILVDVAVLGGVTFIVIVVLMGMFATVSRRPGYCRSCHEMSRDYRSWAGSTHRAFECANCHQEPGLFGYTLWKFRELNMVLARATGQYPRPISADVTNSSCLQCHESDVARATTVSGLRVRHSDILRAGYKCTGCHNTAGHGTQVLRATKPSMDQCSACHNGKQAFSTCSGCHVIDIGKQTGAPPGYPAARIGPITTCRGCHAVEKCNRCHGLELPHPPAWLGRLTHARAGAFEQREQLCAQCHSDTFCNQCHIGFPGHGPDWKQTHGQNGPYVQQGCLSCHRKTNNLCAICHSRYRGIKVKRGKVTPPEVPPVPPGSKQF